jgi:hypothetical protein
MGEDLKAVILHLARYYDEVARALRASVGSTEVAEKQLHCSVPFCTFVIPDP